MNETMQHQLMRKKNDAYVKLLRLRERARIAQIEFELAKRDLEEHNVQLTIKMLSR